MKKIIYIALIAVAYTIIIPKVTHADIPPPAGSHTVSICNTISNLSDFTDIVVVEQASGPESDPEKGTLVESGKCFGTSLYKFSTLNLVYWTKEQFKLINLDNLKADHGTPLAFTVPFIGNIVDDSTHLAKQNIEYSISTKNDGTLSLHKTKITSKYNDGRPDSVELITDTQPIVPAIGTDETNTQPVVNDAPVFPTPTPVATTTQKSWWQKVLCWFHIGKDC